VIAHQIRELCLFADRRLQSEKRQCREFTETINPIAFISNLIVIGDFMVLIA
jgi:hypothetical protein